MTPATQVLGACPHDCPDTCALVTTVQDGVAVKLQGNPAHPHTAGVLCTKVSRYIERNDHPERLVQPLKRSGPKGSGRFEPVTWEAALDDIAARLMLSEVTIRKRLCLTVTLERWVWCRANRWIVVFSTSSAHRCWTARSARPRGVRP